MHCKLPEKTTEELKLEKLERKAEDVFITGYEVLLNGDKSAALVRKSVQINPNHTPPTIYFFVFDLASEEIVFEQILPKGSVRWMNNHEILCEAIPGMVKEGEGKRQYVFDVRTQKTKPYPRL